MQQKDRIRMAAGWLVGTLSVVSPIAGLLGGAPRPLSTGYVSTTQSLLGHSEGARFRFKYLPIELKRVVISFLGTKGSMGICQEIQKILKGDAQRNMRGIGAFFIGRHNSKKSDVLCRLKSFGRVGRLKLMGINCLSNRLVGPLRGIKELVLCKIKNVSDLSPFSKIDTVELSHLKNVSDLSPLKSVNYLILKYLNKVTTLKGLVGIHKLKVVGLKDIDLSPLCTVTSLILVKLIRPSGISKLGSVKNLSLLDMTGVYDRDIAHLSGVKRLHLKKLSNISNVEPLKNVEHLILSQLNKVSRSLRALGKGTKMKQVVLVYLNNVLDRDIANLGQIEHVTLIGLKQLNDLSPLRTVKHLEVRYLSCLIDLELFREVETVIWNKIKIRGGPEERTKRLANLQKTTKEKEL